MNARDWRVLIHGVQLEYVDETGHCVPRVYWYV